MGTRSKGALALAALAAALVLATPIDAQRIRGLRIPGTAQPPVAPPGGGWVGCGSGFAAFPTFLQNEIISMKPEIHPSAMAVARLAAPRLAAGEGVDAAEAAPLYVRDKVALTSQELAAR